MNKYNIVDTKSWNRLSKFDKVWVYDLMTTPIYERVFLAITIFGLPCLFDYYTYRKEIRAIKMEMRS